MGLLNHSKSGDYETILREKDMPMRAVRRAVGKAEAAKIRAQMKADAAEVAEIVADAEKKVGPEVAAEVRAKIAAEKLDDNIEYDFQYTNEGTLLNKKEAEGQLEVLGFFQSDKNRRLFDEDKIKVYEEPCGMEAIMILNTATDQSVFVDYRSL